MTIRCRRIILTLGVLGGLVWNLLSLLTVIPRNKWGFTFAFVGLASLIAIVPTVFHLPGTEVSRHISQFTPKERQWLSITLCLCATWVVTVIACIVFPL